MHSEVSWLVRPRTLRAGRVHGKGPEQGPQHQYGEKREPYAYFLGTVAHHRMPRTCPQWFQMRGAAPASP